MLSKAFILSLVPLVAAHGKVAQMQGDVAGNTTGLAIQGGVVPGPGKNKVVSSKKCSFLYTRALIYSSD